MSIHSTSDSTSPLWLILSFVIRGRVEEKPVIFSLLWYSRKDKSLSITCQGHSHLKLSVTDGCTTLSMRVIQLLQMSYYPDNYQVGHLLDPLTRGFTSVVYPP